MPGPDGVGVVAGYVGVARRDRALQVRILRDVHVGAGRGGLHPGEAARDRALGARRQPVQLLLRRPARLLAVHALQEALARRPHGAALRDVAGEVQPALALGRRRAGPPQVLGALERARLQPPLNP
jgi:hypothetical protein